MPAILTYALLSIPLIGAYAIFALGISVIYRASRVLNLAHGAMAMIPAYLVYSMVKAGVPMVVALPLGVVSGGLLGVIVEWVFVRRLRPQGPTAQTVGTVAVTGLLIALAAKVWGTTPLIAPRVFPGGVVNIGGSGLRSGDIGLFLTGLGVSFTLFTFFKRTQVGLAMRGAAQNRRAASLMGIDPDLAASAAWALGGGLAALAGIMLAAVTNLDPYNLALQVLPAFVAALIGGLESLPGALGGSAIAGLSFGLVPYFSGTPLIGPVIRYSGSPQLALTILTLVVMAARGRRLSGAQDSEAGLSAGLRTVRLAGSPKFPRILAVTGIGLMALPWLVPYSVMGDLLLGMELALIAISLVVLTGWVGQISLAQASFVGIAALTTGIVARGLHLGFPGSLIAAALASALAAVLLGVIALRVRGLYLAVATLIFAWMCDSFLFRTPWLGASSGSSTIDAERLGVEGGLPYFDFTSRRTLYYVIVAVVAGVVFALSSLRDTKTGRAFFAVRGSEMAAASLGIDVVRTKLVAFALSGALAGLAGNMLMMDQRAVVPSQFMFTSSLQFLAIAVVGGLGSLGGAIAAGGVFAALNELFFRVSALSGWLEMVSAALLAAVLLAYPGGLAAIGEAASRLWGRLARADESVAESVERRPRMAARARALLDLARTWGPLERALATARNRLGTLRASREPGAAARASGDWFAAFNARSAEDSNPTEPSERADSPVAVDAASNGFAGGSRSGGGALPNLKQVVRAQTIDLDRNDRPAVLLAEGVTVRFGGLTAVNNASLSVREGEIVGLIGPNGAGKTTLFNAILGLNDPASGRIMLHGSDATSLPPHLRARLGVARTFQVLQLFSELTVFDNLLVATHMHNSSNVFSNLSAGPATLRAETAARERVRHVLHLLRLEEYSSSGVRGLPFGVLRMVELGRALVTGAPLVMLDEPASGLNEAETDHLAEVVVGVRALGVSVLLIEHDVRMVTSVSDYLYVLAQGRLLAEGPPAVVQRHPEVIAAYLGEPAREPAGVA